MSSQQQSSKVKNYALWAAQIVLAIFFVLGAVMKFSPIEKISVMMPWTGQLPVLTVRLLGLVDLSGALGILLPSLLRIKPQVTPWVALCIVLQMTCAMIFHISRGEASVIGVNIFCAIFAGFIAWGRFKKVPVISK